MTHDQHGGVKMDEHYATHEALKRDRAAFEAATTFGGWQPIVDTTERLELRTCTVCHTTLCDGTLDGGGRYEDLDLAEAA